MTVRAEGRRVFDRIFAAVAERNQMVNFQERGPIRSPAKRGRHSAFPANAFGASKHGDNDISVASKADRNYLHSFR